MSKDKKNSEFGLLVAVIGGCATVLAFLKDYGIAAICVVGSAASLSVWYRLKYKSTLWSWLIKAIPRTIQWIFLLASVTSLIAAVWFAFSSASISDLIRPEYGEKNIDKKPFKAATAPWGTLPNGTKGRALVEYNLSGWKRLISKAVTVRPANATTNSQAMLYVESVPFTKDYKTFNAELEVSTTVKILEVYAFLTQESAARSSHELLETLRADPVGVDSNKAHIVVSSPNGGEKLVLFIVIAAPDTQIPEDIETSISLRSFK